MFLRLSGAFVPDRRIIFEHFVFENAVGLNKSCFEFILFLNNYHNSKESWQENAEKQYSFDFTGICCFRCYFDAHKLVFQQRWQ